MSDNVADKEPSMRTVITALVVQVEISQYDESGKLAGRVDPAPRFAVLEAAIPEAVLSWVQASIQKGS